MNMNYIEKINEINDYAKAKLSTSRYKHSVQVANMCEELCVKAGYEKFKGYLAGISHDICKEISEKKMLKLAQKDDLPICKQEKDKTSLLHGRAAAILLKEKFYIDDEDVINAVRYHVSGNIKMNEFAMCLYIADKSEPTRPHITKEYLDNLFSMPIINMMDFVLTENIEYLKKKNYTIYEQTFLLQNEIKERLSINE